MSDTAEEKFIEGKDIAIIGMACRFPGARGVNAFWDQLRDGVEAITFFSDDELLSMGADPALLSSANCVKAKGVLENVELFDAPFFGFSPREAEIMDPQLRFFLECSWEALEDAGYDPDRYQGRVGVYAGCGANSYLFNNLFSNPRLLESVGAFQTMIENQKDFVATWVSYKLNLKGPSVNANTACSTSLVNVHLACQGLVNFECDMALAGGVTIGVPQRSVYFHQEGGILSPDGHCRAFDAKGEGTVPSSGLGIVVLKRLEDALNDRDCIHAIIKGSAINNDGSLKVGFTAPSVEGQAEAIADAHAIAGVDAEMISYVETHGAGTTLGDPIEIAALTRVFRESTGKKAFCAIGSVKTNLGHTDAAAGVAGLIKTVLALKHKMLPPSLHFTRPNPNIDFANSPFYVNATLREWEQGKTPRCAGVSSFGIGGTNAHLIVEEAPAAAPSGDSRPWQLLLCSAKSGPALETATSNLADYLKQNPQTNLADVACTLQLGRKVFDYRRAIICRSLEDASDAIETLDPQRVFTDFQEYKDRPVVFMFPGGGAQYVNMGYDLYQNERVFREHADVCFGLLNGQLGFDLRDFLYPSQERASHAREQMKRTSIGLPALFLTEYALARLWMSWGIVPAAMIGHSLGEYTAACLAGVFSLEEALSLVVVRSKLFEEVPGGAMLSVSLSEDELRTVLKGTASIAAINGPSQCVVSGTADTIEELTRLFSERQVEFRRLQIDTAAHSELLGPILKPFAGFVRTIHLNEPRIPYISNVTGTWITSGEATAPDYWVKHLRQTVRFADGVGELLSDPRRVLLEVGPAQNLSTLVRLQKPAHGQQAVAASMRHPHDQQSDQKFLLATLAKLYLAGAQVDWPGFYAFEKRRRIPLPTYPFEPHYYWVKPQHATGNDSQTRLLKKKPYIADWFYIRSWARTLPPRPVQSDGESHPSSCVLVFADPYGVGERLSERLKENGEDVVMVVTGEQFARINDTVYALRPDSLADYETLFKTLSKEGESPARIAHFWSVLPDDEAETGTEFFNKCQSLGLRSLQLLAQAVAAQNLSAVVYLTIISNGLEEVTGHEASRPEKATVLAARKVIAREHPNIICRSVDIVLPLTGATDERRLSGQLMAELIGGPSDLVVAYRKSHRWVQTVEPVRLDDDAKSKEMLKEDNVWLITDGMSGVGFALAKKIAESPEAKLVLTDESGVPGREEWEKWLHIEGEETDTSRKIRNLQALEDSGAEVSVLAADLTSASDMRAAVAHAVERFGRLNTVIHTSIPNYEAGIAEGADQKAKELFALEEGLRDRGVDSCLLLSSLASFLPSAGSATEAAHCLLADAFARKHNQGNSTRWVNINCESWRLSGEADDSQAASNDFALTPDEGAEVFARVLSLEGISQIIVSTCDLRARMAQENEPQDEGDSNQEEQFTSHARPELRSAYVAPSNDVEKRIANIWQELLGLDKVGVQDSFFDLGGHSLLATRLILRLRQDFQVQLPLRALFEAPTITMLARAVNQANEVGAFDETNAPDLRAEAVLDDSIYRRAELIEPAREPANILITGVTGFLGSFLLHELLQRTTANVFCLVRARNAEEARARILTSLESVSLNIEGYESRIMPVTGDLAQPLLGLTNDQFEKLAGKIDSIYHNGAWVNFTYPYSVLKAANVLGTQEILRLASHTKLKPAHFISSVSVFSSPAYAQREVIREQDNPDFIEGLHSGYAESKWVAEQLVMIARSRGLPVCIYRPGIVAGDSRSGVCSTDDLIWKMIKGCIQLGSAPSMSGIVDITPVNYASQAIVQLSMQHESIGKVFHIVNPDPISWPELLDLIRSFGYKLEQIPYREWHAELTGINAGALDNAMHSLLTMLPEEDDSSPARQARGGTTPRFDCEQTLRGLQRTLIACPHTDAELLKKYFLYFIRTGYMDAPQLGGSLTHPQKGLPQAVS